MHWSEAQLRALVAVVRDATLGSTFLERMAAVSAHLNRLIPTRSAAIMTVHPGRPNLPEGPTRAFLVGIEEQQAEDYWAHFYAFDPKTRELEEDAGTPFRLSDRCPDREFGADPFTADLLTPAGLRYELVLGMPLGPERVLTVGLQRETAQGDFSDQELLLLTLIRHDLARAAQGAILREELRRKRPDTHNGGTLILSAQGALRFSDPGAETLIHEWGEAADCPWTTLVALAGAVASAAQEGGSVEEWVNLPSGDLLSCRLAALRSDPSTEVVVTLERLPRATPNWIEARIRQAGLSPREREVCLLASRGLSNREIARDLSLSVSTVKLHLANAFRKTGAHGRTELSAFLFAGFAPWHRPLS